MAFVICEPCVDVKDTACVAVCPVDCIYEFEGENQLYIQPDECIDCAACQPECPVEAIFPEAEVPSQWQSYIEANRVAFERHHVDAAAHDDAAEPAEEAAAAGPGASATPASLKEIEALRALLTQVHGKKIAAGDALDDVVRLLGKLGVTIDE